MRPVLIALAFVASGICFGQKATTVALPNDIVSVAFTPTGDRVVVETEGSNWFAIDISTDKTLPLGNFASLSFSPDGQIAAGSRPDTKDIYVTDLRNGHIRFAGIKGDTPVFAPSGHNFAVEIRSDPANCEIDIVDGDSLAQTKSLTHFGSDIVTWRSGDVTRVDLAAWQRDGIIVQPALKGNWDIVPGPRKPRPVFFIDPDLDRGRFVGGYLPPSNLPPGEEIFAEPTLSRMVERTSSSSPTVLFANNGPDNSLYFSDVESPNWTIAKNASIILLYGLTPDQKHAAIFAINDLTMKMKRVATGPASAAIYPNYVAISPDGKWVAYRDFSDPKKLDLVQVPKDVGRWK